jgi:predicted RNase H-like nuclease (RuvC/YqgF family)
MGQFRTTREKYEVAKSQVCWEDETLLETLAVEIISDLDDEIESLEQQISEIEDSVCEKDNEISDLESRISGLEEEVWDLEHNEPDDSYDSSRVTELQEEVEFLSTLVADMEEELAVIDSEEVSSAVA